MNAFDEGKIMDLVLAQVKEKIQQMVTEAIEARRDEFMAAFAADGSKEGGLK